MTLLCIKTWASNKKILLPRHIWYIRIRENFWIFLELNQNLKLQRNGGGAYQVNFYVFPRYPSNCEKVRSIYKSALFTVKRDTWEENIDKVSKDWQLIKGRKKVFKNKTYAVNLTVLLLMANKIQKIIWFDYEGKWLIYVYIYFFINRRIFMFSYSGKITDVFFNFYFIKHFPQTK